MTSSDDKKHPQRSATGPAGGDEKVLLVDGDGKFELTSIPANSFPEPPDLRPYVDMIVNKALDRIQQADFDANKPLMLLVGEHHDNTYHAIIKMMVLDRLQKEGVSIAFGLEMSHDSVYKTFADAFEDKMDRTLVIPRDEALRRFNKDKDGQKSLATCVTDFNFASADQANKTLMRYTLTKGISSQFNDASKTSDIELVAGPRGMMKRRVGKLDLDDPVTREAVKQEKSLHNAPEPASIKGMTARNRVLTAKLIEHSQRERPQIYVQSLGMTHVAGGPTPEGLHDYKYSMAAMLKDQGYEILAVPMFGQHIDKTGLPPEALTSLSAEEVIWDPAPGGEVSINYMGLGTANSAMTKAAERRMIRDVLVESGQDPARCSDDKFEKLCENATRDLQRRMIKATRKEDSVPMQPKPEPGW